jgi:TPR repeat protein
VTSFTQVQESKPKKKKTGLWIALVAVAAVAGIYFLGTGDQSEEPSAPAASATVSEKPAAAPEAKVEPAPVEAAPVKEAEPVKETAPVAAEPAKQPTMAEKAAQATTAPAAGPQDESLKQGLEAYEKGDYKLAHDLFKRAATAGNAEACYQLGLMLSTGKGSVAKNPLQGKVWIKKAAGLGHAEAAKALETN